jgi:6-pyruvoyltetrahydropterin/6-carboxytetrahydropterin synthase
MEIFRELAFDAAHRLENLPEGHKCTRVHGHTYRVRVHVTGDIGETSGWVVDFAEINRLAKVVLDQLDHQMLNDIAGLEQPTVENITLWIWARLKPTLPGLSKLTVWEGLGSGCTYRGESTS